MKHIGILLMLAACSFGTGVHAQGLERTVEERLKDFFSNYSTSQAHIGKSSLKSFRLDNQKRTLSIYSNANFGYQPFTEENVKGIYRSVKQSLPGPVNYYDIKIYADGRPIEELVPNALRRRNDRDKSRLWEDIRYEGAPWVHNASRPFDVGRGLTNCHIALWQSHGKYFKNDKNEWSWQRPRLFCTTEDLFTQSFVVPYLIPMLENAGAVVFTPRERDWQKREVIVDNDTDSPGSIYYEDTNRRSRWKEGMGTGFAQLKQVYLDGENPFNDGSVRIAPTTQRKKAQTFAEWIPNIPETGRYAVYVSYRTQPESVTDAKYLVFHKGGVTEFTVNQQMGGGTWVYLGTFEFDKGNNDYGMVVLSNESREQGVVCADAVRFGGGMGNIARGNSSSAARVSGLPRYLEGARYQAQWSGMPYQVYGGRKGSNDYPDDINTRSNMLNYLSGGSVYNPGQQGLKVPFELSLALHSDAGFSEENEFIGSLGIYTTDFNEGRLAAGLSRYASRDLADMVLSGLKRDISSTFNIDWARRSMWNRNYSETRLPSVPSMILEMLSHQNFADMKLGHDPRFKFTVARSVYKSILKYEAVMHDRDYEVQPLPVDHFAIRFTGKKNTVQLTWSPVNDPLEPSASPREYVVYTRIGYGGFDNGEIVRGTSFTKKLEPGLVYSFKVTAVNRGGESFPSEILSAYQAQRSRGTVLIVNGFDRLSGPATVETTNLQGFDLRTDPGVPYLYSPAFCGNQLCFDKDGIGKETADGLGYSDSNLEGKLIAGNTFDYPFIHGKAIQAAGRYSFVSCSDEDVEDGRVRLTDYHMVDLILGVELSPFSPALKGALSHYCQNGGRLFVSGSHLDKETDRAFTNLLKYIPVDNLLHSQETEVFGTGIRFRLPRTANEQTYAVPSPACIAPFSPAIQSFIYPGSNQGAGIAYRGTDYRTFILGFPFESIPDEGSRAHIMSGILHYFED